MYSFLEKDFLLKSIVNRLKREYKCHTVILYGSRARGDHNSTSDYDVAGVTDSGKSQRLASFDLEHKVYLDIFIYHESDLANPGEELLKMSDGIILLEKEDFGKVFLQKLHLLAQTHSTISPDEIEARKVWYGKMLLRADNQDIEGRYRHIWAIFTLLEDYFIFRGLRYWGPKKAFDYLSKHDKSTLNLFDKALNHTSDLSILNKLIEKVINK